MSSKPEFAVPYTDYFASASHFSIRNFPPEALSPFHELNVSDIQRTQIDYPKHIKNSRAQILRTAERAIGQAGEKPKKALILGPGNCVDIPLVGLAQKFDEVTLVESDRASTEKAVKQLPPFLQEKIIIVGADLTGVLGNYTRSIKELAESSPLVPFLNQAITLTHDLQSNVQGKPPDLGNDYTFVSSHLVLSQLGSIPYGFIQRTVYNEYGKLLPPSPSARGGKLLAEFLNLTIAMQQEHIRYLFHSVAPDGLVHFADGYFKTFTSGEEPLETIDADKIDPIIDSHFTLVGDETRWERTTSPKAFSHIIYASTLAPIK